MTMESNSVENYTTTTFTPWWKLYHLTDPAAVSAKVKGGEGGQMIWSMAVSPSDPKKLLYGTDTSGIWRSDDGGATWEISTTGLKTFGTVDIAYNPDDSKVAYVASCLHYCGTISHVNDHVGIYKSADGGVTWKQVLKCDFYRVQTNKIIKFGPADGKGNRSIYVGSHSTGIFKSDDDGVTWNNLGRIGDEITDLYVDSSWMIEVSQQSGVVVSTDGGLTWQTMNNGLPSNEVTSLAVNPADPANRLVVINGNRSIYKTLDAGATWSQAATLEGLEGMPLKLLFSGLNGDNHPVLYLTLNANKDTLRYSTDLGKTFITPDVDNNMALRKDQTGYWAESTTVDSNDPWTVWTALDGVIYKSTKVGSVNLVPSTTGVSGMRGNKFLFDDLGNITYIAVLDHGIYKVAMEYDTDYPPVVHLNKVLRHSDGWSAHSVVTDPTDRQRLFAKIGNWGDDLILEESKDGGYTWTQIKGTGGGYGSLLEYHPQNNQIIYAGKLRSTDNGKTWTELSKNLSAVSSTHGDIVYSIQGSKIYKSADKGDTWIALEFSLDVDMQKLTVDWLSSDRLWVGTFNDGLYRIDGDKVTHIGPDKLQPSMNGNYGIFNIAQDPNNPNHYVAGGCDNTAMGPGAGLFESFDGGDTWELIPGMPGMKDIWSMQFNSKKPQVYLCTSNGILVYDWSKRTHFH